MASQNARIGRLEKQQSDALIFAMVLVKEGESEEDAWAQWEAENPLEARCPERIFRYTIHTRSPRRRAS